jgi:hypothetical protein
MYALFNYHVGSSDYIHSAECEAKGVELMLIIPEKCKYESYIYFGKENTKKKKKVNFATTCMSSSLPITGLQCSRKSKPLQVTGYGKKLSS